MERVAFTKRFPVALAMRLTVVLLCTFLCLTAPVAQTVKPFSKEVLLNAVRSKRYTTEALVEAVQRRGVDFQVTPQIEAEFRQAGAFPALIAAMRANYRPNAVDSSASRGSNAAARPSPNVAKGPPLTKDEVITLLQSGVPSARVEQIVEARGVQFVLTPAISREIAAAGGTRSLLGAISEHVTTTFGSDEDETPSPSRSSSRAPSRTSSYDDLMERALDRSIGPDQTIDLLSRAIRLDPSRPEAYQLLGPMLLYEKADVGGAARAMRSAIERGGSALFRVYHDHAGGTFQDYCEGSLYISKNKVVFESDNGGDSYDVPLSELDEAKLNRFVGNEFAAFHIRIKKPDGKKRNYNFAPATKQLAESRLILSMIGSQ